MPSNKPQSNYSRRPIRRLRLPKIGPLKSKGLFEEYFYTFLVVIFAAVAILGIAGGLGSYEAVLVGLWVSVFTWFARLLKSYLNLHAKTRPEKDAAEQVKQRELPKGPLPLPPGMKPMIGPQWPLKTELGRHVQWPKLPRTAPGQTAPTPTAPGQDASGPAPSNGQNRPGFIYQRPTLPDRKPKLPANWPGKQDKKPKR